MTKPPICSRMSVLALLLTAFSIPAYAQTFLCGDLKKSFRTIRLPVSPSRRSEYC